MKEQQASGGMTGTFGSIAKVVNSNAAHKIVLEGKQPKLSLKDIFVFHNENCRNALDAVGRAHTETLLNRLKAGKSVKTLTLAPFENENGAVGLKIIDGFHTIEAIRLFVQHLSDLGTKEVTINGVKFTSDPATTILPINVEAIDNYNQEIYKMTSQYSRKNSDLETVEFILSTLELYNIPLSKLANDIGKSESTLKNLLILNHCLDSTKAFIRNGDIKGSRVVKLMRFAFNNRNVDLRVKNATIPTDVLEYIDMLVTKEVEINKHDIVATLPPAATISAATDDAATDGAANDDAATDDAATDGAAKKKKADKQKKAAKKNVLKLRVLTAKKMDDLAKLFECLDTSSVEFDEETKINTVTLDASILDKISLMRKELDEIIEHNKQAELITNNVQ